MLKENTIRYIGFYDTKLYENENRCSFLAATNKMDYIAKSIVNSGKKVEIVSPSWTDNKQGYYPKRKVTLSNNVTLTCCPTFGSKIKLLRSMRILLSWVWLFMYLIRNTNEKDEVIVYHSMFIMDTVMLAKKVKKFKLILEVEEIYQDVVEFSKRMKRNEYKFFNMADKYIFPTELLNKKLNVLNKPYSLIYGTYQVKEEQKIKVQDTKIHVVYAGTFDPRKGGALAAVEVAEYLPKNYHIHIIGFGSKEDTESLMNKIKQVSKISAGTLTYDGLLKGKDYIEFLKKCDIGLSTQNPHAKFNDTSFPSKILSYMANGLRVVSARIKVVEISPVGHMVYYYNVQSPKAIAEAIMRVDMNDLYDSIKMIRELDKEFICNIKELLEK